MAKILFISQKIDQTSWSLATSLKMQGNEIHFLTTKNQDVPAQNSSIEILSFFKKWNSLEALRFIPFFLMGRYDAVHFLLEDDELNSAQSILSTLTLSMNHVLVSTSLLNITIGLSRRNPVRYLLERSHLVTAPTVEMLAQLRGLNVKNQKQLRGVLPPVISFHKEIQQQDDSNKISQLLLATKEKKYIVVPLLNPEHQSHKKFLPPLIQLSHHYFIVFVGTLGKYSVAERKLWEKNISDVIGEHWCLSGDLNSNDETSLLQQATAIYIAGQDLSPMTMTYWLGRSAETNVALMVDDRQTRLYPGLWEHQNNSWIFSRLDLAADIERWLKTGPPHLSSSLSESLRQRQELLDAPLNELHRLYNRLIS